MDIQTAFNIALSILGTLFGWLLHTLWGSITKLQEENKDIVKKIGEIEVLVAGDYVKRESFEKTIEALFRKIDGLYDLLSKKADK
jgi:hypothetical protein